MSIALARTAFVAAAVLLAIPLSGRVVRAEPEPSPSAVAETINVQVLGAVRTPGAFALPAGARLSDALEAGGLRTPVPPFRNMKLSELGDITGPCVDGKADLHRVFLTRVRDGKQIPSYMIDLARSWPDPRYDVMLRDGDKIFVPECREFRYKVISHPSGVVSSMPE